jgi:BirA family biotin operon repressor/biotin-[acetyl-CoA-carboxylase] ligase
VGSHEEIRSSTDGGDEPGWPPGWHVRHVAETGSTNADLLAAAAAGAPDRSVLVAGHQTAGRGRLDRTWIAPPNVNLLVSLLFRDLPPHPTTLMHRVGVAAVEACRRVGGVEAVLKWPNDLVVAERKLAGVLAQHGPGCIVVGVGVNIGWAPEGGTCLGSRVSAEDVLRALLQEYDALPADIEPAYRERLSTLGRRVAVELPAGKLDGTAVDVDDTGALIVVDTCGISHRLEVGDVVHVRPSPPTG